ncbi:MAG: tetratricopeptide repeat protein [bacterium]
MASIDPELWRRADAVFQDAVERPASERDAFIAAACAGDDALRALVLDLVAADTGGSILDEPVAEYAASFESAEPGANPPAGAVPPGPERDRVAGDDARTGADLAGDAASSDPLVGRTIGRFRVLRRLGEGGMGIVYEAEQEEPRRRVALKLMRGGWAADSEGLRFFRREAQMLARLQHPGIAAIHEAGRTDDGQPFFAMELVRGVPLDEAFGATRGAANQADLRERLDLFLEICDAIAYAHQRGVIHRDLKPSNILVSAEWSARAASRAAEPSSSASTTRASRVKVVDFGLARISDADATLAASRSEPRALQGTLPYMSPEQTLGNPDEIDFRSDVYSLGVILYRMLAGEPPYAVRADALLEAVRTIRETVPRRAGAIAPLLRGDVETILAKALEKEPARRYQSVMAFAEDVRRFLSDQPILARPASGIYHLRKLAARHRAATALLATLFVVLVGATITMTALYQSQRRERENAVLEARKAERISVFLQEMLASADPDQAAGREVTVREVLERASREIALGLASEPAVAAAIERTIGVTYQSIGRLEESEHHLRSALAARERLLGPTHPEFAASLRDLAGLRWYQGAYADAESLAQRALGISRGAFGDEDPVVADALTLLAGVYRAQDRLAEAESLARTGQAIYERRTPRNELEIARALIIRAEVYEAQGRFAPAESLRREILTIERRAHGADHSAVAQAMVHLANVMGLDGRYAAAESLQRAALPIQRKLFGDDHPKVAHALTNLGHCLNRLGRAEEAEAVIREGLAIRRKAMGPDHPEIASSIDNLALVLWGSGRVADAEPLVRESLEMKERLYGTDHSSVADGHNNLASVLRTQGKYAEAEPLLRKALEGWRRAAGDEQPVVASGLNNLGLVLALMGRHEEADTALSDALAMRRRLLAPGHPDIASSLQALGGFLVDRGRAAEAEPLLREAHAACLGEGRANDVRCALVESILGGCLTALRRYGEAESLLVRCDALIAASSTTSAARKAESRARLAALYTATGDVVNAGRYRSATRD